MTYPLAPRSHKQIVSPHSLIAAGPAAEIGDDFRLLDINELITGGREGFVAYEVGGDSMVDHIRHGYLVFVDTWAQPRNGDIVATTVNGLTCVKVFTQSNRGLYLVSKNKAYLPREVKASDDFCVLGVVRGHVAIYRH